MTVVLVQGNPETAAIWSPLITELGRDDVVCLSPPGFGAPLPDDFPATPLAYRDWLTAEMNRAILTLYRSAAQPGLAVLASEDTYVGTDDMRRRAGARVEVLDNLGHWWMLQDPARGAAMFTRFWSSLA